MEDSFELDLNDILNEKIMPATLFLHNDNNFIEGTNITRKHFYQILSHKKHNMNDAITTMGYHREKMNEYLVSNFVAKQIVSDLAWNPTKMQRRLGTVVDNDMIDDEIDSMEPTSKIMFPKWNPKDELLYDQGSIGYKQWLEKTTTLEDIQRQFGQNQFSPSLYTTVNETTGNIKLKKGKMTNVHRSEEIEYDDDDYEEGEITGYAYQKPINTPEDTPYQTLSDNIVQSVSDYDSGLRNYPSYPMPTAGSKNVYFPNSGAAGSINPNYITLIPTYYTEPNKIEYVAETPKTFNQGYFHPTAQETYGHHEEYGSHYPVQNGPISALKEIGLKDIIDIALTTLAFLSFGMFILQVLMCITMSNSSDNNNMMMMPMEMNPDTETEPIEEIRRKRRSIENYRIMKINELSRRVLLSIDTVIYASKDDGKCLQKVLCENNNFAREQKDGQKIWIPVWSLGISWLSSRFSKIASALNGLKATAIGLGGGNCTKIYSTCEIY